MREGTLNPPCALVGILYHMSALCQRKTALPSDGQKKTTLPHVNGAAPSLRAPSPHTLYIDNILAGIKDSTVRHHSLVTPVRSTSSLRPAARAKVAATSESSADKSGTAVPHFFGHTLRSAQQHEQSLSHARAIAARHPELAAGGKHALKGHHLSVSDGQEAGGALDEEPRDRPRRPPRAIATEADEARHARYLTVGASDDVTQASLRHAMALEDMGSLQGAARLFGLALAAAPDNVVVLLHYGRIQKLLRNFAGARQCYTRALELAPNDLAVLNNLAILLTHEGRQDEAQALCRHALTHIYICICIYIYMYVCRCLYMY